MATLEMEQPESSLQAIVESRSGDSSDGSEESEGSDNEPWDVKRSYSEDSGSVNQNKTNTNNNMRPPRKTGSEDSAELPALSLSGSQGSRTAAAAAAKRKILSGQRTLRPLSPPSSAGLEKPQDRDDTVDTEEDDDDDGDEMPMDERLDHQRRVQQEQQEALCGADEATDGMMSADFCGYSLGDICGVSPNNSPPGNVKKLKVPRIPKQRPPYGVEEQTAIEVEYVDPEVQKEQEVVLQRSSPAVVTSAGTLSPRRGKNAMLKAMAKRAKDDYQQKKDRKESTSPAEKAKSIAPPTPPDNVYSTLNPSEKRKFLKLINSGLSPSDATQLVLQEREQGAKDMEQVGEGSSSKNSKPRLAFWKRNKGEQEFPKEVGGDSVSDADSVEGERLPKSGINYYDAVRKEDTDKDDSMEEDGGESSTDDEVAAANKSKNGKKKNLLTKFGSPSKSAKFSPLDEKHKIKEASSPPENKQQKQRSLLGIRLPVGQSPPKDVVENTASVAKEDKVSKNGPRSVQEAKATPPPPPPPPPKAVYSPPAPVNIAEDGDEDSKDQHMFKPIAVKAEQPLVLTHSMSDDSLLQDDEEEIDLTKDLPEEKKDDLTPAVSREDDDVDDDDLEDHLTAQLLGASPDRSRDTDATTPDKKDKKTMEIDTMDLDVETYLNSTELMSTYGGGSVADHLSVVSGKSYKTSGTAYTNGTNYTTSSRVRRPGAAKQRLASSSKKSEPKRGWQETIQAAAATTNRVWDPQQGWVDYVNPDTVVEEPEVLPKTAEKIHVPVKRRMQAPEEEEESNEPQEEAVILPFPSKWEQERSSMLKSTAELDKISQEQSPPKTQVVSPSRSKKAKSSPSRPPISPSKPRGWMETMKAATQNLNTDGKRWDPEKGWVGLNDNAAAAAKEESTTNERYGGSISLQADSDTQDFGVVEKGNVGLNDNAAAAKEKATTNERYGGSISLQAHSDTQDFGVVEKGYVVVNDNAAAGATKEEATTNERYTGSISLQAASDTQDFGAVVTPVPQNLTDQPQLSADKPDPKGQLLFDTNQSVDSEELSHGASTKSGKSGRYIQIGDAGSVKSHYRYGKPKPQDSSQALQSVPEPTTPDSKEVFVKLDEARKELYAAQMGGNSKKRPSLLVNVVKEKVDPAGASMFPKENKARRSSGPVDLDEIHDMEHGTGSGSFDGPVDFSWDDDGSSNVSDILAAAAAPPIKKHQRNAVPRIRINMRETSPKDGSTPGGPPSGKSMESKSFDSMSSTGKSIPKLRGPKRDTSPIRGRKPNSKKGAPPQPEVGDIERRQAADPQATRQGLAPPAQVRSVASRDIPIEGALAGPEIRQPELSTNDRPPIGEEPAGRFLQAERSMKSRWTPTKSPKSPESPGDGDTKSYHTADSSPSPSSVKLKAQIWEKRSSGASFDDEADQSGEFQMMSTQKDEWKSFLTKKVQAESVSANQQQSRLAAGGKEEDRDSLFDFPETEGAFPSARRSGSNQMRLPSGGSKNKASAVEDMPQRSRDFEPHAEAFEDISDLSPIRVEDDDDDDAAPSETSSAAVQPTSFLARLQACAAPIMPRTTGYGEGDCNAVPMAHLAFLRTNPSVNGTSPDKPKSARFVPPNLCGRPDIIVEEDDDTEAESEQENSKEPETRQREENPRPRSNPRSSRQSDVSSVISDEAFGAKTAYLESIAMKAAVSGSKKKRRNTSGSETSSISSKHSEKWQRFLDKKAAGASGSPQQEQDVNEEVSRTAEKYAAEKVEEMMEMMAQRGRSTQGGFPGRPMEEATGAFPSVENSRASYPAYQFSQSRSEEGENMSERVSRKSESARAAEDLAAARVEAMMQALSSQNLDEGEI